MKEENDIRRKLGSDNPFTVPEGYFENFTKNLMDKLPEKEIVEEPETTLWQRAKPWVYMAAMFVGMMFSIRLFVGEPSKEGSLVTEVVPVAYSEEEVEEMMDYSMIDDYTVYRYLTDASEFDF